MNWRAQRVVSSLGEVTLACPYYHCRHCRTTEDAGTRLRELLEKQVKFQAPETWDWSRDRQGRCCAYVSAEATGVRQQGVGGAKADGRMAYVGSMQELGEQSISARRIRRQVEAIGGARVTECEDRIETLKAMTFKERRTGSSATEAPQLAVVMMDGGRYQRRDYFGQEDLPEENTRPKHWRESKVGCLLSMESDIHSRDPCGQIPDCFTRSVRPGAPLKRLAATASMARGPN